MNNRPVVRFLPQLEGLRGVAILLVLLWHFLLHFGPSITHSWAQRLGADGVTLFFVLSGYLITRILLTEELTSGRISLRSFYIRRMVRLLPVCWVFLFVIALGTYLKVFGYPTWKGILASLVYVRNFGGSDHATAHLWSLSLEEQFYIVWPLCLVCVKDQSWRIRALLMTIISVNLWRAMATFADLTSNPGTILMRSDFRIDAPAVGALVALLEVNRSIDLWLKPRIGLTMRYIGCAILAIEASMSYALGINFGYSMPLTVLASGFIVASVAAASRDAISLLSLPAIRHIGKLSYSLYIWHPLFVGPANETLVDFGVIFAIFLSYACAVCSYQLFEKPFLSIRSRIRSASAD